MAITVYSERYVAFLDILGFSDIVRRSTTLPEKATELIAILEDIANANQQFVEDMQLPTDDFKAQSFSDCIVLSENASPIGLFHLLASVTMLSFNLLTKGIFTRGGIAKGSLHHSDKVVFGPAMIDAYRLESLTSRYPRVLVDRATHLDYNAPEYAAVGDEYKKIPTLRFADDGPPFLDILVLLRPPSDEQHTDEMNPSTSQITLKRCVG
jgi:hypothetical protein